MVPDTHEFRYKRVVVYHPPHRDHGHAGRVVCVNRSGTIALIEFECSGRPLVYWLMLMRILRVAAWQGSDAAILPRSVLEGFDSCELDNANVALARERLNQRQNQYSVGGDH